MYIVDEKPPIKQQAFSHSYFSFGGWEAANDARDKSLLLIITTYTQKFGSHVEKPLPKESNLTDALRLTNQI